VIYNEVEEEQLRLAAARPERPYLLYVGGFEPRKNLEGVFAAVSRYQLEYDPAMELHLTGTADQLSHAARINYEELCQHGRIQFLGSPCDEVLAREYACATALLMLSRAEGFGLPVIEAMVHGCPVIAARCGALPEIVGDAGILVAPDDIERIVGSIHNVAHQPGLPANSSPKGGGAKHFTWKRAAEAYLREYQSAASNAVANPERAFPSTSSVAAGFR
jgi:alpha-1,3-rhamnosyl/mannosyltransferase